ncbi:MAG: hypothetical protein OXI12_04725, partial [Gammaproteobacteria bacterium]|nr:hypothetical protein [Gammaproteobacteria bacterium]
MSSHVPRNNWISPLVALAFLTLAAACVAPADDAASNAAAGSSDAATTQPVEADHFVPATPENAARRRLPTDHAPLRAP